LRSGTKVIVSQAVIVPARRTATVRMKTAALAATSRRSTPLARVRVSATGGLSATLVH